MVRFDFFIYCFQSSEKDTLFGIERKQILNKSTLFVKVKFVNKTIPSVVYPRLMQPQMLQLSILVFSERLHTYPMG